MLGHLQPVAEEKQACKKLNWVVSLVIYGEVNVF